MKKVKYKIKKDDNVIVTTGKDKGRTGKVLKVLTEDAKVLVEGINLAKKHTRENPNMGQAGGIHEKESPIHISNVALYNVAAGKAEKVGIKTLEDGRRVRYFKKTGEVVDI